MYAMLVLILGFLSIGVLAELDQEHPKLAARVIVIVCFIFSTALALGILALFGGRALGLLGFAVAVVSLAVFICLQRDKRKVTQTSKESQ